MELHPPLHLGVVAIEKGAFGSPLTAVANFSLLINQKCQEKPKSICWRCFPFIWRHCGVHHVKLLIRHAHILKMLSKVQMVRNPLLYDLYKCHELQSFWPNWKSDSCLEMCLNWTSFCILLEHSWKDYFCNMSS